MSKKTQTAKPIMKRTGNERFDSGERACRISWASQLKPSDATCPSWIARARSSAHMVVPCAPNPLSLPWRNALTQHIAAREKIAQMAVELCGQCQQSISLAAGPPLLHLRTRPASNQATDDGANSLI